MSVSRAAAGVDRFVRLGGFRALAPLQRLSGAAVEGGAIGYTFNTTFLRKAMTAPATITRCLKPEEIGWKTGMPGLLMFEEAYRIDTLASGTQMRHSTRCWGPFSRVASTKLKGRILASMEEADRAFERYLRPGAPVARRQSRVDRRIAKRRAH